eukprot:sb/3461216/
MLYSKTYLFTGGVCVDEGYGNVSDHLADNPEYCLSHPCWDTTQTRFCVCNGSSECDNVEKNVSQKYHLPDDYMVLNGTFTNIFYGTVRLIVLISTENYPDVLCIAEYQTPTSKPPSPVPAYRESVFNLVYFVAYIFIGLFLLTSVLLAVIVEFWLRYLRKTNDMEKGKERQTPIYRDTRGEGFCPVNRGPTVVNGEVCYVLTGAVREGRVTSSHLLIDLGDYQIKEDSWNKLILLLKKDFTRVQSRFMFQLLDWEDKKYLDVLDFLHITELLKLDLKLRGQNLDFHQSSWIKFARKIVIASEHKVVEVFHVSWVLGLILRPSILGNILVFFYQKGVIHQPSSLSQVTYVIAELFLFIIIIVYVFLGIGLELFSIMSDGEDDYFEVFQCGAVDDKPGRAIFTHQMFNAGGARSRRNTQTQKVLQVIRSTSGNWRQSVVSANNMIIASSDLDKIQAAIEKEKVGHGTDKGQLYLGDGKDDAINVKVLMDEKVHESKNLDKPECILYLWAPVVDHTKSKVGELVMEIKDHHSHDATIKINLNTDMEPLFAEVVNMSNTTDCFFTNMITFSRAHDDPDWKWHGVHRQPWSIRKQQRIHLRNDNISVIIPLVGPGDEEKEGRDLADFGRPHPTSSDDTMKGVIHQPSSLSQVTYVIAELFLFIIIIVYVFLGIGLELFSIMSDGEDDYFEVFQCGAVDDKPGRAIFTHQMFNAGGARSRRNTQTQKVLQVIRSTSGNWRQSVVSANNMIIASSDLDKIQAAIEKEKVGHGADKGQLYLGDGKDDAINVKVLMDEKVHESKNLDKPECILYLWAPVVDHTKSKVGELVMEIKDHHSHDATIKINLNTDMEPLFAEVVNMSNTTDCFFTNMITFSRAHDDPDWKWHGVHRQPWSIRKQQRIHLRNDNISVIIPLVGPGDEDKEGRDLADFGTENLLIAQITGYQKTRKRWDAKQEDIKNLKTKFTDVSYLLENNAYRIFKATRQWSTESRLRLDAEGTTSESNESEGSKAKEKEEGGGQVYVIKSENNTDPRDTNHAKRRWDTITRNELSKTARAIWSSSGKKPAPLVRNKTLSQLMMGNNTTDNIRKLKDLSLKDSDKSRIRKAFSKSPSPSLSSIESKKSRSKSRGKSNNKSDSEDSESSEDDDEASESKSNTRDTPGSVKKLIESVYGSKDSLSLDLLVIPDGARGRKSSASSIISSSCLPSKWLWVLSLAKVVSRCVITDTNPK